MPTIYLPNDLYNKIVWDHHDVNEFVRDAVKEKLEEEK